MRTERIRQDPLREVPGAGQGQEQDQTQAAESQARTQD